MTPAQSGLFEAAEDSPLSYGDLVRIPATAQPLRKPQRDFNRLTAQVQALREQLASWQAPLQRFRERLAGEVEPLQRSLHDEQRAAVLWLDQLLASAAKADRLTRRRRDKLVEIIAMLAEAVLAAGPDDEVEAIFDRHSDLPTEELREFEMALAESVIGSLLGEDAIAGHAADNPEDLLRHAHARMAAQHAEQAQQHHQDRADARRARGGRPSRSEAAAERKAQAEREASQSVREVFRRLAASLHPDRETDPAERTRKTALMQRVNQAYARNDLLELLSMQIEIEQIDAEHLAAATDARLASYCAVLREQTTALQDELLQCQAPLHATYGPGLPPRARTPALLDRVIDDSLQDLNDALSSLRRDMDGIRDPARRAAVIDAVALGDEDEGLDDFDLMLLATLRSPPRKRRGKRKKPKR